MASVLPLPPPSLLDRSFAEPLCPRSQESVSSRLPTATKRHTRQRSHIVAWPLSDETNRLASRSVLNYIRDVGRPGETPPSPSKALSLYEVPRDQECDADFQPPTALTTRQVQESEDSVEPFPPLEPTAIDHACQISERNGVVDETEIVHVVDRPSPFKRWLSTLRKRHPSTESPQGTTQWLGQSHSPRSGHHKTNSLSSSVGVLTAVKSATLTRAGTSIAPSTQGRQSYFQSDAASMSFRGPRLSIDSASQPVELIVDSRAWYRSIQRRNVVQEIMESEESYISDMKAMIHIYCTLLASTNSLSPLKRKSVQKSVSEIIHLHEALLAELQNVVPTCTDAAQNLSPLPRAHHSKHIRWHSVDNGPAATRLGGRRRWTQRSLDMSRSTSPMARSMVTTTNTVLNVAKVFGRFMKRFQAYEGYVAYHEIVHAEASSAAKFVPSWPTYERGVEALSASVNAVDKKEVFKKKGLTLSDLGIKPIQRICKYPLFFADLCKHTPACDDPTTHAELEKVVSRLQETAEEIDFAMNNPETRHLIEATWILRERLVFREENSPSASDCIRDLGHVVLCGVLHVAYEAAEKVKGQYSICILYRACLVLATPGNTGCVYYIDAIVPLLGASIESPDDGRGLQCHTASHTWKLFFLHQQKHYEVLLSACSQLEEYAWKRHMRSRIAIEARDAAEGRHTQGDVLPHLAVNMKSVGPAIDVSIDLVRRLSMRRAATLGTKTNMRQVIIKNTHAQTPGQNEPEDSPLISRSKSHMSSSLMPTLAPRRAERVRMESMLTDVWSRDRIPYPGMAMRRPENTIRASANSVMRKLSMASIASNFSSSKRSGSIGGPCSQRIELGPMPSPRDLYSTATRSRRLEKRRSRAVVVDFHNAPTAFLPEDFELKRPTFTMRGQSFVRRAMTMEGNRPPPQMNSPLDDDAGGHKRSASISGPTSGRGVAAPTPFQSEDSGYSSGERAATATHTRSNYNSSPQPSTTSIKAPIKVKSRLFKILGVTSSSKA